MITKRKLRTVIGKLMDEIGDKIKAARTIEDSGAADKSSDLMFWCGQLGLLINLSLRLDLYTKKQREDLLQAIQELGLEDKPKEENSSEKNLRESVEIAREYGVEEDKILHNYEEGLKFFTSES